MDRYQINEIFGKLSTGTRKLVSLPECSSGPTTAPTASGCSSATRRRLGIRRERGPCAEGFASYVRRYPRACNVTVAYRRGVFGTRERSTWISSWLLSPLPLNRPRSIKGSRSEPLSQWGVPQARKITAGEVQLYVRVFLNCFVASVYEILHFSNVGEP